MVDAVSTAQNDCGSVEKAAWQGQTVDIRLWHWAAPYCTTVCGRGPGEEGTEQEGERKEEFYLMICAEAHSWRLEDLGLETALASKLLSVPQATLRDIGLKEG